MNLTLDIDKKIFNKIYYKYLNLQTRRQIFFGGSSSGKSYFLAQRCILDILTSSRNYLICRAIKTTIKKSVFNEITKAITNFKLDKLFIINQTDLTITCINGNQILFCGLDDPEKVKSITPKKGIITDIWIEEATEISYQAYKQLGKRLRGKTNLNKRIILSFNPIYKTHWIYSEFFILWDDSKKILDTKDTFILHTTCKHNKFLSKDDIAELENETDKYYYDVYTLGLWGVLGAVIFKNWETRDLEEERLNFGMVESGIDFGFTDPNVYLKSYYNKNKKTLYILDEVYISELTIDELYDEIIKFYDDELIMADSEEPQSIKELFRKGLRIKSCKKGKGSVEFGYKWLKQQHIVINTKCLNTIKEFTIHKYKEDKNGVALNYPEDRNNHAIDALRYSMQYQMANSVGTGVY
jgi:phage terminase large subunit